MTEESKIDDMKTVGTESDGSRNERSPRDFWGGGGFVGCLIGVVWGAVAGGASGAARGAVLGANLGAVIGSLPSGWRIWRIIDFFLH